MHGLPRVYSLCPAVLPFSEVYIATRLVELITPSTHMEMNYLVEASRCLIAFNNPSSNFCHTYQP